PARRRGARAARRAVRPRARGAEPAPDRPVEPAGAGAGGALARAEGAGVIEPLAGFSFDAVVVCGGGIALLLVLRFGAAALDAIPMSRARRQLVTRVRPIAGGALILAYLVFAARWLLREDSHLAPLALGLMAAFVVAASWGPVRDLLEGAYLRAARTRAAGDRVQLGQVRGRVQRLGYRHLYVEGS